MAKQNYTQSYRKPSIAFQVLGIIITTIFLLASGLLIWVAACDTQHGEVPDAFGWSACSSNGEYEGVQRDALILIDLLDDTASYEQGNVVAFYYPEAPTATKIYLGSISALEDGQVTLYVNENLPELSINQGYVLGRAEYYIADVGYFFAILEGGYGLILAISIAVLCLAILFMFIGNIVLKRRYAAEDEELQKQLDIQEALLEKKREEAAQIDLHEQKEELSQKAALEPPAFMAKPERAEGQESKMAREEQFSGGDEGSTVISGSADSGVAQIELKAGAQQAEVLKKLFELAVQQNKMKNVSTSWTEGEPGTLHIECSWKDVPVVSAILVEVQKRQKK